MAAEMRDGIRKVLNKRESKRTGKNVYSYKVPYRDANGKQTSETFGDFKAAERFRNKVRSKRDEGMLIDEKAGRVSVRDYATKWLEAQRGKRANTYAVRDVHMRLHIIPALGGRQLRAVDREDLQTFVNALTAKGLAPRTVAGVYKTLVAMYRCAHLLDKKIPASPCLGIVLPEVPDDEVEVLTVAQVRALAAATPDRYRAAVLIAAGTGLRASEVMGLTWDRIDLEARTVKVDRQINAKRQFAPPKTRKSRRTVPMPEMVAEALTAHRAACPPLTQTVDQVQGKPVHDAELIFTRPDERPITGGDLARVFAKVRTTVDLPGVRFHDLRHTYASLQIAAGTSLTALQERMGHGSIKVTSDTYGHLLPEEDDRTRTAIDNAFATDHDDAAGTS
jgi:integrase